MKTRERVVQLIDAFPQVYPGARCELDFRNPLELLVGTIRLSQRLGLTKQKDADKIERDLMKLVPREHWTDWSHWLIWHGRRRCYARKPDCSQCEVFQLCPSGKIFLRTGQARKSAASN